MSDVEGLAEDERDWIADVWDEETTVSASVFYPVVARIVAAHVQAARAEAWDLGFAAGDAGFGSAATPNPYRAALRADDAGGEGL